MTDFCQHVPMSRLFETQNSRGFIDPTLRSLCGVIEIQPLRGCKKSVFYQTIAYILNSKLIELRIRAGAIILTTHLLSTFNPKLSTLNPKL